MKSETSFRKSAKLALAALAAFGVAAQSQGGLHNWQKVDLRKIKVRGEIGRRVDLAIYGNLMKVELENQFLDHFREKKLRGDSVGTGKLVEYAARFAAYTGDPKVLALKKYVVDELLKTQDEDGYIGCLRKDARLWGYWDLAETGFIILGLAVDHHYFGEKRSLAAAERAANFIIDNWKTMPEGWETAYISGTAAAVGLCCGMEALYRETGNAKYLDFCTRERQLDTWYAPVTLGRDYGLYGHSATHLYQCTVQMELQPRPTPALRRAADETAAFMLDGDGTLVSGACGLWECWTDDQSARTGVGETCSTAFQLRLWDLLVQCSETPSARWGDALERTMYNALFGAQSKDGRKVRYYTPLEGERMYYPSDTYCCPNNFRRIMAELPEYLFYKSGDAIFANLYSECDLETEVNGAKVRIEERTAYPTDSRIDFTIKPEKACTFAFSVRIPGWCKRPSLVVGGERVEVRPGTVATVRRDWKDATTVTLDLPMEVEAIAGRKRQTGRAAFLRGPILYALNPALNGGGKEPLPDGESHVLTAEEQKAADLRRFFARDPGEFCGEMVVDAATAKVVPDDSVRPGGTAIEVRASTTGHAVGVTDKNGSTIRLTEFPDCDATATYFRILDASAAVPDPVFTGDGERSQKLAVASLLSGYWDSGQVRSSRIPSPCEMRGPFPIMSVAYHKDGSVDYDTLVAEARYVDECGCPGVIWGQSDDAVDFLTLREKELSYEALAKGMQGRDIVLVFGCNGATADEMLACADAAQRVADRYPETKIALSARPPDDTRTQDDLERAWRRLGEVARRPCILQTFTPGKTPTPSVDLLVRLAKDYPAVFGYVKEESGGGDANERIARLNAAKPAIKNVFAARGGWSWLFQTRHFGAEGLISERCAFAPLLMKIWREMEKGERADQNRLTMGYALYRLMIDQRDFDNEPIKLRGYRLYFLQKAGVFKNRTSRIPVHPPGVVSKEWRLEEDVPLTDAQKRELDALYDAMMAFSATKD